MMTNRIRARYATHNRPTDAQAPSIPAGFVATPACFVSPAASGNGSSIRPPTNRRVAPPPCRATIAGSSRSGTDRLIRRSASDSRLIAKRPRPSRAPTVRRAAILFGSNFNAGPSAGKCFALASLPTLTWSLQPALSAAWAQGIYSGQSCRIDRPTLGHASHTIAAACPRQSLPVTMSCRRDSRRGNASASSRFTP